MTAAAVLATATARFPTATARVPIAIRRGIIYLCSFSSCVFLSIL